MILIADLRNFYFAFIHGFLTKQVFIISLVVVVVNDLHYWLGTWINFNIVKS